MGYRRRQPLARAVGNAIRTRRLAAGLSQKQLCARMDQEPNHLSDAENGRQMPKLPRLIEIARAIGCSASDIVKDAEQAL